MSKYNILHYKRLFKSIHDMFSMHTYYTAEGTDLMVEVLNNVEKIIRIFRMLCKFVELN